MRKNRAKRGNVLVFAAALLAGSAGCFGSGNSEPEPKNLVKDPSLGESDLVRNAKSTYDEGLFSISQKNWAELRDSYPGSYYVTLAELKSADAFFFSGDYGAAVVGYQEFIRLHPGHEAVAYARYQIARANFEQYRGKEHDQSPLLAAVKGYTELVEKNPESDYALRARRELDRCKELRAEHIANVARFYEKMGLPEASENRLAVLEGEFPASEAARKLDSEPKNFGPRHATKEQPQSPLIISQSPIVSVPLEQSEERPQTEAKAHVKPAERTGGAAPAETPGPAAAGRSSASRAPVPEPGPRFVSGLNCASASGKVVISVRTSAPLETVQLAQEQAKHMSILATEAEPSGEPFSPTTEKTACSAGPVTAVLTEEYVANRRGVRLALSALRPMRFFVLTQGRPLQIAATPAD